jgi:hypothetical protein
VWFTDVSTCKDPSLIPHLRFAVNDADSASATCADWFEDVETVLVFGQCSLLLKLLEVVWKIVAHWADRVLVRKLDPQSIYVAPQRVLSPKDD